MRNNSDKVDSIFDLKHSVIVYKGKRIMACHDHCCDIHGMTEGEYYKQKRLQTKEKMGSS